MNLATILTVANLILIIAGAIGGYMVLRSTIAKTESDVQTRVRDALSAENQLLQSRVARVEKENKRLDRVLSLIVAGLKKAYGIELEVDDDMVTFRSKNGTHVSRITTGDLVP